MLNTSYMVSIEVGCYIHVPIQMSSSVVHFHIVHLYHKISDMPNSKGSKVLGRVSVLADATKWVLLICPELVHCYHLFRG